MTTVSSPGLRVFVMVQVMSSLESSEMPPRLVPSPSSPLSHSIDDVYLPRSVPAAPVSETV